MALNPKQKKELYELQEKILNFIKNSGRYDTQFPCRSLVLDLSQLYPSKSTYVSIGFCVLSIIFLSFTKIIRILFHMLLLCLFSLLSFSLLS
jgi:hypothetical protein